MEIRDARNQLAACTAETKRERRLEPHVHMASTETPRHRFEALYDVALPATRIGSLYTAFPYPTKISPETIALYIVAHTNPGDTVFDGFAGTGTTGLAALLCENPTPRLRQRADQIGLRPRWGSRNAVLYELNCLGAFVADTLNNPPNPQGFRNAAKRLLGEVENAFGWLYGAEDPNGGAGRIRHVVWADVVRCPSCHGQTTLWDNCVSLSPAKISPRFRCSACNCECPVGTLPRVTKRTQDDLNGNMVESRLRRMGRVYGITGQSAWARAPTSRDVALLAQVAKEPIPQCVPNLAIPWGDLYRRGYHGGISHVHHFYTRRNLITFGRLWEKAATFKAPMRNALRFWLLSYNTSHATIMTRVVAKSGQDDLALTSAQPGVLYVSGLPVEKNLFRGLERKLSTVAQAFESIYGCRGRVIVHKKSSRRIDLPEAAIDYVFTDPPFGGNIPYSEISFLNEAWLGRITDSSDEIIVSRSQRKTNDTYRYLLTDAFREIHRILRPQGKATLVFHSAKANVWNALQSAYSDAGFSVEHTGVLDKIQPSFKQVTTNGTVRGDPVLLLKKRAAKSTTLSESPWRIAAKLRRQALELDADEQTPERLYSRLVNHYLANHQRVPVNADEYYRWYSTQQRED